MRYKVDRWFEGRRLNRASGATSAAEHDKRPGAKARGGRMALGCRARARQFASVAYVIRKVVPPSRARSHSPASCSRCATTPSKRSRPHALDPLRRVPLTADGTRARPSRRSKIRRQVGARAKVGTGVSEYNHDQATRRWRWCLDYIGCAGTCVKRAEC